MPLKLQAESFDFNAGINVTGSGTFSDGTQGLILGAYTGGSGYGAIYPYGVTPGATNYSFVSNSSSTNLNAATQVILAIGGTGVLTTTSTGINVTGTGTFSSNISAGAGTGGNIISVNGGNSGTGAGALLSTSNAGSIILAFGNKSAITGGAYDPTPYIYAVSPLLINTDVTATSFTGAGTGLTGTAAALNIGGNSATATNAAQWGTLVSNWTSGVQGGGISSLLGVHTNGTAYAFSLVAIKDWLGLSTPFLPLTGGTISRDVADAVEVLTVDQHNASSTGNIQNWKFAGLEVAHLEKDGTFVSNANIHGSGNLEVSGLVQGSQFKLTSLNPAPSSSSDTGTAGEIRFTADYIYLCTGTNTWKRAALTTF